MHSPCSLLAVVALVLPNVQAWLPDGADPMLAIRNASEPPRLDERKRTPSIEEGYSGSTKNRRWLSSAGTIRGVNLGSLFVFEPWIGVNTWTNTMGCTGSGYNSEFDCMLKLGSKGDATFQAHWSTWITESDFDEMVSYGLNTVRIPVGYWMYESLVDGSEHFPKGGIDALKTVCGWASDRGFYIIIDLHGAPGAQVAKNAFTGQSAPSPGFYSQYNYDRATKFLGWLRAVIHDSKEMRNVGMIEVVNEPVQNQEATQSMRSGFYRDAYNAIRSVESSLGVSSSNYVHIQYMGTLWGSGSPSEFIPSSHFVAYDDHRYLKWDPSVAVSHESYIQTSCRDNRSGPDSPTIVGEFSLSVPDDVAWSDGWHPSKNVDFYKKWFAAQVTAYETRASGWVFWTWKSELGDYRWSYKDAVAAGVIPKDLGSIAASGVCDGL